MGGITEYIKYGTRRLRASSYVGQSIGGYRVTGAIGAGAFGIAFRAKAQEGENEVLLKLVDNPEGKGAEELLWPEAAALSKCEHPGIPAWLGVTRGEAGEYFMVQSLMPGVSLASMLAMNRVLNRWRAGAHTFSMQEICLIGEGLIDILEHAFSRGVMHGDVRAANVLFDGNRVSLVDFGLACFFEPPLAQAVFETDDMIDRMGLADTLLFLLYSDSSRATRLPGVQSVWIRELDLSDAQRQLLLDLFAEDCRFSGWKDIRTRFRMAFCT